MSNVTGQPRVTGGIPGGGAAIDGALAAQVQSDVAVAFSGPVFVAIMTQTTTEVLLPGIYDVAWESALECTLFGGQAAASLFIDTGGGFVQQGDTIGETPASAMIPNMFNQTTRITIAAPVQPTVEVRAADLGAGAWVQRLTVVQFIRR